MYSNYIHENKQTKILQLCILHIDFLGQGQMQFSLNVAGLHPQV